MTKKKNAGGGNGGLAMTAQTEVDGWVEVFQTNFSNAIIIIADAAAAVAAAAADPHQAAEPPGAVDDQLLLQQRQRLGEECQASLAVSLALYGQVRPDDEVAAFLAQHDSRFQSQPLPHHHNNSRNNSNISAALLIDQPAWIQRDDKRNTSRQLAAQVQTSRNEALALTAEILHHEVATLVQSNKMKMKKKKNSTATTADEANAEPMFVNLQIALRDMQEAVAETKCHMDEWDPMVPQSIHQLAEQLGQIQRGIAVLAAPSQTQDAIDQVLNGLRLECRQQEQQQLNNDGDDEEDASPTEVWATILRRNNYIW
jgi:hypothetical protein